LPSSPLIAVDIGNSRIKFGLFTGGGSDDALPEPVQTIELPVSSFDARKLDVWLAETMGLVNVSTVWWIASVNRPPTERLAAWLQERGAIEFNLGDKNKRSSPAPTDSRSAFCRLKHSDLPIVVSLPEPGRVGIDRLLGALAVNRLRATDRQAIVIDVGSAITVDVVSPQGAFLGGAILPGIGMSARAMHEFTDLLPLLAMDELVEPPPALGTSTLAAMQSGLYWGAIGAMKELRARLADQTGQHSGGKMSPEVYLTGGAAPSVAKFVDPGAKYVPHLVLGGIALVALQ
jgi:type III pantothenate kinase